MEADAFSLHSVEEPEGSLQKNACLPGPFSTFGHGHVCVSAARYRPGKLHQDRKSAPTFTIIGRKGGNTHSAFHITAVGAFVADIEFVVTGTARI